MNEWLRGQELFDSHVGAEFKNEIRTLSQIEHLNLVRFLGFVEHADERIVLVEYVANGNLRDHLDGDFLLAPTTIIVVTVDFIIIFTILVVIVIIIMS